MRDLQQVEATDHAGQQVVEIVRDAARQLSDGFHLLRLAQRLLGLLQALRRCGFLGRDVASDRVQMSCRPGTAFHAIQR